MKMKDITVRGLVEEDLVEVSQWFINRKWFAPPNGKILPEDTGYVAEIDGRLLSVAWLYITNSHIGIIDWIATNPESGTMGLKSIKKLLDYIEEVSRENITTYMHFTSNERFAKYIGKNCRFKPREKGVSICMRTRKEVAHG